MEQLKIGETGKVKGLNVKCVPGSSYSNCSMCIFWDYDCTDMLCKDFFYVENKTEIISANNIDSVKNFIVAELEVIMSFMNKDLKQEDEEIYNSKSFAIGLHTNRGKYLAYMNVLSKIRQLKNG